MPSGHGQDYADHDAGQARRNGRARVGRRAVYPIAIKETSAISSLASTISTLSTAGATRVVSTARSLASSTGRASVNENETVNSSKHGSAALPLWGYPASLPDAHSNNNNSAGQVIETINEDADSRPDILFNEATHIAGSPLPAGSAASTGSVMPPQSHSPLSSLPTDVSWAAYDTLASKTVLLTVSACGGFTIWDISDAPGPAREVFHLAESPTKECNVRVVRARLLPQSPTRPDAVCAAFLGDDGKVVIYDLHAGRINKVLLSPDNEIYSGRAVDISTNDRFIAISCISPPIIHMYDVSTLSPLPLSPITDVATHPESGLPVYAMSPGRLLAFASTMPISGGGSGIVCGNGEDFGDTSSSNLAQDRKAGTILRQGTPSPIPEHSVWSAETARRFGEGIMASAKAVSDSRSMFSRSAPNPSKYLSPITRPDSAHAKGATSSSLPPTAKEGTSGTHVIVVDLVASSKATTKPRRHTDLSRGKSSRTVNLVTVAHFRPSKSEAVVLLSFSPNASQLLTSSATGQSFHIFELRPPSIIGSSSVRAHRMEFEEAVSPQAVTEVWHRYRLNRGLTVAAPTSVAWSHDGRFVVVSTRRGTSHVFAINPSGGQPVPLTHTLERMVNLTSLQPLSITLSSIARFRHQARPVDVSSPGSHANTVAIASSPPQVNTPHHIAVRSDHPPVVRFLGFGDFAARLNEHASLKAGRNAGKLFTNLAIFYAHSAELQLNTVTLATYAPSIPAQATSAGARVAMSGLSHMMRRTSAPTPPAAEVQPQLSITQSSIAYYLLQYLPELPGVPLETAVHSSKTSAPGRATAPSVHLAELETFSRSPAVLPRSLYLSSSFAFHAYPPTQSIQSTFHRGEFGALTPSSTQVMPKRWVVREEVSHTHQAPLNEAQEGSELRNAMHTVIDYSYSSRTIPQADYQATEGRISDEIQESSYDTPAYPNGYGRSAGNAASRHWRDMRKALPGLAAGLGSIPIAIPLPRNASATVARSVDRVRNSIGGASLSPSANAVQTASPSPAASELAASTLSFEDDAILPSLADAAGMEQVDDDPVDLGKGRISKRRNHPSVMPSYGQQWTEPVSLSPAQLGGTRSRTHSFQPQSLPGMTHASSSDSPLSQPSITPDLAGARDDSDLIPLPALETDDEWSAWKLDGIDDGEGQAAGTPEIVPTKEGRQTVLAIEQIAVVSKEMDKLAVPEQSGEGLSLSSSPASMASVSSSPASAASRKAGKRKNKK